MTQNLPIGMVVHAHDKSSIRLPILSELYAVAQTMRCVPYAPATQFHVVLIAMAFTENKVYN